MSTKPMSIQEVHVYLHGRVREFAMDKHDALTLAREIDGPGITVGDLAEYLEGVDYPNLAAELLSAEAEIELLGEDLSSLAEARDAWIAASQGDSNDEEHEAGFELAEAAGALLEQRKANESRIRSTLAAYDAAVAAYQSADDGDVKAYEHYEDQLLEIVHELVGALRPGS